MKSPKFLRSLLCLAPVLVMLAGGCASLDRTAGRLGSSAGGGLVRSARGGLENDSTQAALRMLAAAAVGGLGEGISRDVTPALKDAARRVFGTGEGFLANARDTVSLALSGPVNRAIQQLIRDNSAALASSLGREIDPLVTRVGTSVRGQLALTFDQVGADAQRTLVPVLETAVDRMAVRLAENTKSGGPLRTAIDSAVASAVRTGIQSAHKETQSITRKAAPWAGGALAVVLGGVIFWLVRERQRSQKALRAIGEAVKNLDDPGAREAVKNVIKTTARKQRIDGYLHSFLEKHQLLQGSERPRPGEQSVYVGAIAGEPAATAAGAEPPPPDRADG